MSTKISELTALSGGIPATNAVPISVDGTTYKVNLGDLAELNGSADVKTALAAANKAALSDAVVDGTAIDPSSIGATTRGIGKFTEVWIHDPSTVAGLKADAGDTWRMYIGSHVSLSANVDTFGIGPRLGIGVNGSGANSFLYSDASSTLAQRNDTNPQEFRIYGTYTSSTNYERLSAKYDGTSSSFVIGTEKGSGGGTARPLEFRTNGTTRGRFDTSGNFTPNTDATGGLGTNTYRWNNLRVSTDVICTRIGHYSSLGAFALVDGSGFDWGRLCFGGTTSSYPALKRSTTGLEVKLGDDSNYTSITASAFKYGSNGIIEDTGSTSLTLSESHNGKVLIFTGASAATITLDASTSKGFSCLIINATNGFTLTFAASGSASIVSIDNNLDLVQHGGAVSVMQYSSTGYHLGGNLS